MKCPSILKILALATSVLALNACGSNSTAPTSSKTQSLTGFPTGTVWPCQDYVHQLDADHRECLRLPVAGSHPSVDVLIELRGFDAQQTIKVRDAIREFGLHWEAMRIETPSPNDSAFGKCLDSQINNRMWATTSVYPEQFRNKGAAIAWAVLNIQYMFEYHAKNKVPLVIAATGIDGIMGQAFVGSDGANNESGDLELATPSLNDPTFSGLTFAGTLMHEWFHRKGYQHPNTSYEDPEYLASLTVAAGQCVRHGNNPGLSLFGPTILAE
ncbi:MAG: hypothetical protein EOP14_06955 [Pseudomonas sp.]|nr:MAG: hypothetical protein EOP14_06955 [Pseudomonas sp.]